MRNLSNACVFGEFLLWIVLQCYCALRLDGEAQGGDPVGNDDEALSGRLPGLPGKSQFKRVAELLLADAGRHAGIAHYGFAARLEFRKAARSPRTPAVRSDRRGLPSASSSRSWVMPHAKCRACDAWASLRGPASFASSGDSARISRADCNSHCGRDGDITSAESRTASEGTNDQREHW